MAVIFSAAAAYLSLRVGQVFEAAIPIAIIAVGLSNALGKKNPLGQNVIIQSIGACSGVIVAGAIFTLPALFILQAKYPDIAVSFYQIFCSSLLGGILGILFFIPFRKYFVKDMHGKYPFPEATATTQVLVSSQSSGKESGGQAKTLIVASLIGGVYDYIVATFGWWAETVTSVASSVYQVVMEKTKLVLSCNTGAALLGPGYIVGLKYAFVIFACLFDFRLVDNRAFDGHVRQSRVHGYGSRHSFQRLCPPYRHRRYSHGWSHRHYQVVVDYPSGSGSLAGRELKGKSSAAKEVRWQLDISMKHIVFFIAIALVAVFLFFRFGVINTLWQAIVAWLVVVVIAFLFTTVAANAIAIVGTNPVSGMTLMTLIIASAIFVAIGLNGTTGIVASMVIGGVVCTALSMAKRIRHRP